MLRSLSVKPGSGGEQGVSHRGCLERSFAGWVKLSSAWRNPPSPRALRRWVDLPTLRAWAHPMGGKPALSTGSEAVSHTAVLVPRLAIKGELVLHGNLSCSRVYNGCHTSFDKLLLAKNERRTMGAYVGQMSG